MASDGSQKNSSRKSTRRGTRKSLQKPPRFGREGHLAHLHHLLPVKCVQLDAAPKKPDGTSDATAAE
jgi:hypothetical protein